MVLARSRRYAATDFTNWEDKMAKIATIVSGRAKPGKRDQLFQLFEEHLAPRASANDAQQVVVWLADEQDPQAFYLFEIYRDPAAMEANSKADWFWAYMSQAGPLLDGQPEMKLGTPRWSKFGTS
jgi:(4S)-4-hydroxy-5-phosphonooxypentane-2,3-dione isomerase